MDASNRKTRHRHLGTRTHLGMRGLLQVCTRGMTRVATHPWHERGLHAARPPSDCQLKIVFQAATSSG